MNKLTQSAIDLLKKSEKIMIVFDTDGDGIGAAVILAKSVKRAFGKTPRVMPRNHGSSIVTREMIDKIKGMFDLVVFLDMPADEIPEYMTELAERSNVLIVDHHQLYKNMNGQKNIVHINSSFWQSKIPSHRYCASKMTYDICKEFAEIGDLDWLAGLGIANDMAKKSWMPFMKAVCKRNRISLPKLELVNHMVTSSYRVSERYLMTSFNACFEAKSPLDILKARTGNSKKIKKFYNMVQGEIDSIMKGWRKKAEIHEDKKLIILDIKTKFSNNSAIATIVSFQNPHYTVMFVKKKDNMISVNLRRQDKRVDCNKLAKKLIDGLENARGGGHKPAASIRVMKKDWKTLRKRMIELS
jgi:single-stranded DNA-specific DHH superfamily exonuclease